MQNYVYDMFNVKPCKYIPFITFAIYGLTVGPRAPGQRYKCRAARGLEELKHHYSTEWASTELNEVLSYVTARCQRESVSRDRVVWQCNACIKMIIRLYEYIHLDR